MTKDETSVAQHVDETLHSVLGLVNTMLAATPDHKTASPGPRIHTIARKYESVVSAVAETILRELKTGLGCPVGPAPLSVTLESHHGCPAHNRVIVCQWKSTTSSNLETEKR